MPLGRREWALEAVRGPVKEPQMSFKWGPRAEDPLAREEKERRITPDPRLMAQHMESFKKAKTEQAQFLNKAERKVMFREWGKIMQGEKDRVNERFAKDFMCFLQGHDPSDPRDPAYVKDRLRRDGINPEPGPLMARGVKEWIGSHVDRKAEIQKKLTMLRMGPHKLFEWDINHLYLWYKYVLRGVPYQEDAVLEDFDRYWPSLSESRGPEEYRQLGPEGWAGPSSMGAREPQRPGDFCKGDPFETPEDAAKVPVRPASQALASAKKPGYESEPPPPVKTEPADQAASSSSAPAVAPAPPVKDEPIEQVKEEPMDEAPAGDAKPEPMLEEPPWAENLNATLGRLADLLQAQVTAQQPQQQQAQQQAQPFPPAPPPPPQLEDQLMSMLGQAQGVAQQAIQHAGEGQAQTQQAVAQTQSSLAQQADQNASALASQAQTLAQAQMQHTEAALAPVKQEIGKLTEALAQLPEAFQAQGQQLQGFLNGVASALQQSLAQQAADGKADREAMGRAVGEMRDQMQRLLAANAALTAMTQGLDDETRRRLGALPGMEKELERARAEQAAGQAEVREALSRLSAANTQLFQGTAVAHEAALQNANAMTGLAMHLAGQMQGAAQENRENAQRMADVLGDMRDNAQKQQSLNAQQERINAMAIDSLAEAATGVGAAARNIAALRGDVGALRAGLASQLDSVLSGVSGVPDMMLRLNELSHAMRDTMPDLAEEINGNLEKLSDALKDLADAGPGQAGGPSPDVEVTVTRPDARGSDDEAALRELKEALLKSAKDEVTTGEQKDAEVQAVGLMAQIGALENRLKNPEMGDDPQALAQELAFKRKALEDRRKLADERTAMQKMVAVKNWLFERIGTGIGKLTDKNGFVRKGALPVAGMAYNAASAATFFFSKGDFHLGVAPMTNAQIDEAIGSAGRFVGDIKDTFSGVREAFTRKDLEQTRDKLNMTKGQLMHGAGDGTSQAELEARKKELEDKIAKREGELKALEEAKGPGKEDGGSAEDVVTVKIGGGGKKRSREAGAEEQGGGKRRPGTNEPAATAVTAKQTGRRRANKK